MGRQSILFGAFDRHNFGDLLFPHVAAAMLGAREVRFAGVSGRDMRPYGGHATVALDRLAEEMAGVSVNLIHGGGEVLTCDAWQAAVMVSPAEEVQRAIAAYDRDAGERLRWGQQQLRTTRQIPYVAGKALFSHPGAWIFCGVGGVELMELSPSFRTEVLGVLRQADYLSVRDLMTQSLLGREGISAELVPDPAVMVEELFGDRIRRHGEEGAVVRVRSAFPKGYLAVQFSADFGDDATLAVLAAQLDSLAAEQGLGLAFFRAGAAPWHDDLEPYQRLIARLRPGAGLIFDSLNLWDICALIAASQGYCGSSLHGRIVAMAFALPRLNVIHPSRAGRPSKQEAYAATWDAEEPAVVAVEGVAEGMRRALYPRKAPRREAAHRLRMRYRQGFAVWEDLLT